MRRFSFLYGNISIKLLQMNDPTPVSHPSLMIQVLSHQFLSLRICIVLIGPSITNMLHSKPKLDHHEDITLSSLSSPSEKNPNDLNLKLFIVTTEPLIQKMTEKTNLESLLAYFQMQEILLPQYNFSMLQPTS